MSDKLRLKSELWDKVQYMFRGYYDRMMHVALYYDGKIELDALKDALCYILERIPVLRSSFVPRDVCPYWQINNCFNIDEYVSVVETNTPEKKIEEFLTGEIDPSELLQIRVRIVRSKGCDAFLMLTNHMCGDGGDLKYLVGKIVECYNSLMETGDCSGVEIKCGTRSFRQLYSGMKGKQKIVAHELWTNASAIKNPAFFPYSEGGEERRYIIKNKLSAVDFGMLKKIGKQHGATVNDMLLTVYARAIAPIVETDKPLSIVSMIDLRRYLADGQTKGYTNMTGFMPITVDCKAQEGFFDTLEKVKQETKRCKEDKYLGLHGTPLLRRAFHLFPIFSLAQRIIKLGYKNPPIGMSNIGILGKEKLSLSGLKLVDAFFTGALKFRPYMQLAFTTFEDELTFTVAIRCTPEDKKMFEKMFVNLHAEIDALIEAENK